MFAKLLTPLKWFAFRFAALFASEAMKWATANKEIGIKVVLEVAKMALNPEEKREAAFQRIKILLLAAGISFRDHFINLLIEMVVTELKAQGQL